MRQTEKEQKDSEKGKQEDKEFLRTEPLGKLLLKLALPTVAAQLINMLYNIVDRIYIGHIPGIGATALTGVGVCMPLIMIVLDYNAVRFTWREIKGQWFRLAVYGLSVLLFLYHVLAFAGVFSIPRLIPDHMDELRFYVEATLALVFVPLTLLTMGIVIRDSWRKTFGKPL